MSNFVNVFQCLNQRAAAAKYVKAYETYLEAQFVFNVRYRNGVCDVIYDHMKEVVDDLHMQSEVAKANLCAACHHNLLLVVEMIRDAKC